VRRRRHRPPDPEARPRAPRSSWAPATLSSTRAEDRDIDREVSELVAALREDGPMRRRDLRRRVESRLWGPGRFREALWLAQRRGLVRREGNRLAATDGGSQTGESEST
jgi:hypothetical protein